MFKLLPRRVPGINLHTNVNREMGRPSIPMASFVLSPKILSVRQRVPSVGWVPPCSEVRLSQELRSSGKAQCLARVTDGIADLLAAKTSMRAMMMPPVHHVRPEFEEDIVDRGAGDRKAPGLHDHSAVGAAIRIIGERECGCNKVAGQVGYVEHPAASIVAVNDRELGCVETASHVATRSQAKVAWIFVIERWKQAVGKEAHAGLAQQHRTQSLAECSTA
jgi:hypothetical protein